LASLAESGQQTPIVVAYRFERIYVARTGAAASSTLAPRPATLTERRLGR